jgi:hypothetical protein
MAETDAELVVRLKEARTNLIIKIEEYSKNPKPTYEIDGQKVAWKDYLKQLMQDLKELNEAIVAMDETFEIHSTMYT